MKRQEKKNMIDQHLQQVKYCRITHHSFHKWVKNKQKKKKQRDRIIIIVKSEIIKCTQNHFILCGNLVTLYKYLPRRDVGRTYKDLKALPRYTAGQFPKLLPHNSEVLFNPLDLLHTIPVHRAVLFFWQHIHVQIGKWPVLDYSQCNELLASSLLFIQCLKLNKLNTCQESHSPHEAEVRHQNGVILF